MGFGCQFDFDFDQLGTPGARGGYVLDAFAMALHCVWTTDSAVLGGGGAVAR